MFRPMLPSGTLSLVDRSQARLIQQKQKLNTKNRQAERERVNVLSGRREVEFNPFK
jgi:hypothetical protein